MPTTVRWGILGAGIIAGKLADAVRCEEGHELVAVASKTSEKARDFASRHGARAARDYDELVNDPSIDVVYVATTHNFHHANARLALEHDKHVLVEKPLTVNADEAEDLVALAGQRRRFLMEAMWTRFLPAWQTLRQRIADGGIGEVRQIDVSFGGIVPPHYAQRLKDPALAGGVSLDMGVYPLSFLCHVLRACPIDATSMARMSETGVDEIACYLLRFAGGCLGTVATSYDLWMPARATLHGTRGIVVYADFQRGETFEIHRHNGDGRVTDVQEVRCSHEENGFVYQVREVHRCLAEGRTQSEVMPWQESIAILRILDGMRAQWPLRYPFE